MTSNWLARHGLECPPSTTWKKLPMYSSSHNYSSANYPKVQLPFVFILHLNTCTVIKYCATNDKPNPKPHPIQLTLSLNLEPKPKPNHMPNRMPKPIHDPYPKPIPKFNPILNPIS